MFIRAKYVLQFSRCNDRQNTGIDPAANMQKRDERSIPTPS